MDTITILQNLEEQDSLKHHPHRLLINYKRKKAIFITEKPGRYYLTQVFRVDIIRMGRAGIL